MKAMQSTWQEKLLRKSKQRTYKRVKESVKLEKYFDLPKYQRSLIVKSEVEHCHWLLKQVATQDLQLMRKFVFFVIIS